MSDAIDRFLEAARVLDHPVEVRRFPEGTKTAEDAARAIGCDVAQIVKSLVDRFGEERAMGDARRALEDLAAAVALDPEGLSSPP